MMRCPRRNQGRVAPVPAPPRQSSPDNPDFRGGTHEPTEHPGRRHGRPGLHRRPRRRCRRADQPQPGGYPGAAALQEASVIHHKVGASDDGDLNDNAGNYRDCINTYVADQKTLSAKHIEAANAAVKEYNEFMQAYTDYKNQNR